LAGLNLRRDLATLPLVCHLIITPNENYLPFTSLFQAFFPSGHLKTERKSPSAFFFNIQQTVKSPSTSRLLEIISTLIEKEFLKHTAAAYL